MPRNLSLGASTLRNRNRVTNKTRLRIVHGNIDADPMALDEDEEKARVVSTAGVDAEDANEHHLQAVLSAASQRHQALSQRTTRGGGCANGAQSTPVAYIPTPDSTGIVDNYEELYPSNRWKDPATYIRTSETVEAFLENGFNDQFTYTMDDRDKDWLDRNNEEARGEGTSAQGAASLSGTTTRSGSSTRSAKAKGKEPETGQSVVITEDEFELVMGLFERVTHETTPFLHHAVEEGQPFPPFSDYQEAFSSPIPPHLFASFQTPVWVPQPTQLVKIARTIYLWWKERCTERGGHRIMPTLNFNEADIANESYICFRHREIKAVRKTRAQQAPPSDKVQRLRQEMTAGIEIALTLLRREELKREVPRHAQSVWNYRVPLLELKRTFSSLGSKEDEELLVDKERVPKKLKADSRPGVKLPRIHSGPDAHSPTTQTDPIPPKVRSFRIQSQIEKEMLRQKERDHHWEDQIDNVYQAPPVPYHHRLFKYIPSAVVSPWRPSSPDSADGVPPSSRAPRALRLRCGRGGRLVVDRRTAMLNAPQKNGLPPRSPSRARFFDTGNSVAPSRDETEMEWRMTDRWKYDLDDHPAVGPEGSEEQDRILIDDYDAKYIRHSITLLTEHDVSALLTDASLLIHGADPAQKGIPIRLSVPGNQRREAVTRPLIAGYVPPTQSSPQHHAPPTAPTATSATPTAPPASVAPPATPVSVPTPLKKMVPPITGPPLRISANGGMRLPNAQATFLSPPAPPAVLAPSTNGVNGVISRTADADVNIAHHSPSVLNGNLSTQPKMDGNVPSLDGLSPPRPKSQNQHRLVNMPNGYTLNGYQPLVTGASYLHHANGLSAAQVNQLKSVLSGSDMALQSNAGRMATQYMPHVVGPNAAAFNMQQVVGPTLKVPGRPMHWPGATPQQRAMQNNALDVVGLNGVLSPSPSLGHPVPARSPSAPGVRPVMRAGAVSGVGHMIGPGVGVPLGHQLSPRLHPSPSPLPQGMAQVPTHPSPPRATRTPTMLGSPSVQHQQPIGTQGAY